METFKKCLESDYSCDKVIEEMQRVSKIKVNKNIDEEQINHIFFKFCSVNFTDKFLSFVKSDKEHTDICNENIFKLSQYILSNKKENDGKICTNQLELFYQTFFFYEFNKDNETNDFIFYKRFPENVVEQDEYETYLFNIGKIIFDSNYKNDLIEILFSEDTPLFLRNIALVCFLYIRSTSKNVDDFISFCVPCLNHYNLYYLCEGIKQDLNYQFTDINEINYYKLEQFLAQSNSDIINGEPKENFVNIDIQISDSEVKEEELCKYFCFPNKDEKDDVSLLFTSDNLKKNKDKFLKLIKSNDNKDNLDNGYRYKINYDNPKINDKIINAFSLMFLLKNKKINKIDKHFFQIYNYGNTKIELFSYLFEKYLDPINNFLSNSITEENKINLFKNSGFYKLDNDYVFLITINEEDEKNFYLKLILGTDKISSVNKNTDYQVFQVKLSDFSSIKEYSEANEVYINDIEEEVLYNFGNYSFKNELRTFFKNFLKDNKDVIELPRLYFLLNYTIPISLSSFQFITNVKSEMKENCSYGYAQCDFVLKNGSNEDIIIDNNFHPYKEKIFMTFPEIKISNDKKIILKKNSIIFFEFKASFPQFNWKSKFSQLLEKIKKFLEIYKMRGLYNNEYIQIYYIYDNVPDIYYINDIKRFMINHPYLEVNYEFGIYYFTRGINLINNQILENNIKELKEQTKNLQNMMKEQTTSWKNMIKEFLGVLNLKNEEERRQKIDDLKAKYNIKEDEN